MHGATNSIQDPVYSWAHLMPLFATMHPVIHIEHRAHGRTNNPAGRLTYHMIADDVCAWLADGMLEAVRDGAGQTVVSLTTVERLPTIVNVLDTPVWTRSDPTVETMPIA